MVSCPCQQLHDTLTGLLLQDVKGPQTIAFNLPNDERIVNERGTSMVMLKNISEAKYAFFCSYLLSLIAN
jgi:hypothetical protein